MVVEKFDSSPGYSNNPPNKGKTMATEYHTIVFIQDEQADEIIELIRDYRHDEAVEFLSQWDYGDESEHSPTDEPSHGSSDGTYESGDYILAYNLHLNYVSLTRVVTN